MLTFYDSQNQPYVLGEQLGRGGEGTVFLCEDLTTVAKIYHEPIEEEKAEKLRWMAENKDERLLKTAAWVIDVLYDRRGGKVVGFLMPNVRAKEIHELYSLKSRRIYFPEATWHFLVHTAANVARAFYSLHRNNHVMGDVNHGNCVVLADGTVKLIDCDSYSIKKGDFRYRCEVGVATHLAPELQNIDLGEIEREANHDNFGLAVIIFQLLFLGRHPFAGNYLGEEDKSLEDCIREHRFAYGETAKLKRVKQPPGTLSLNQVSPRVSELFERAFSSKNINRPEPREWIEALEDLSDNLEQCSFHPGHLYYKNLTSCPWCEIEGQTGVMLFPFVSSAKNVTGEKEFNIFTIENLIANLGISTNLPAKPIKPHILPLPSAQIVESQGKNKNWQYGIIAAHFLILATLMATLGVGVSCFLGFLLMAVFITILNNTDKNLRTEVNHRLTGAQQEWDKLESDWSNAIAPKKLTDDLAQIKLKIGDYQNLQRRNHQQLKSLEEKHRAKDFEIFSSNFKLSNSKIPEIEESQFRTLEAGGIKTAADLTQENLSHLFMLDADTKNSLLEWREDFEKNYRSHHSEEKLEKEKSFLTQTITENRRAVEREIEYLFASLRSGSVALRQRQQQIVGKSEKTAQDLVQAESDMEVIGSNSFAVLALLLITFVMPFIGILFSEANSSRVGNNPPPPTYSGKGGGKGSTIDAPDDSVANLPVPSQNISDKEIAEMPESQRDEYAGNLYRQALSERSVKKNITAAEQKLQLAVRLEPTDVVYLNELAFNLYEQGKYDNSLNFLKRSLKVDKNLAATKIFIGMNYLMQNKHKEARDVLEQATINDPDSYEAFYNLGLAYENLEKYSQAVTAFRSAVKINSNDADAQYELGYCFYKLGDRQAAYDQYKILLEKDNDLATRLYETAKLKDFVGKGRGSGQGSGNGSGTGSGYGEGSGAGSGSGGGFVSGDGEGAGVGRGSGGN